VDELVYSTDKDTAKKTIVAKTCANCKKNPLMDGFICNTEMTDINNPHCIIIYNAIQKVFPTL